MSETTQLELSFYLNDKLIETKVTPTLSALELIRERYLLTGAKQSCNEGDCGSCTIAVGAWRDGEFSYLAINSCIMPAVKLHNTHLLTIEGLGTPEQPHIIQQAILENRATQCGYCTPGVIMSLFCLLANNKTPTQEQIYAALEGNLCRCTGYVAINKAANYLSTVVAKDPKKFTDLLIPKYALAIQSKLQDTTSTITEVYPFLEQGYKIINGGTDLMVAHNVQQVNYPQLIDISRISELNIIAEKNNEIIIGGAVTLSMALNSQLIAKKALVLQQGLRQMASTQIRNVATLAGNVANASPIGGAACLLLGLGAKLILSSKDGERTVALENFYLGYKKTELRPNELITELKVPLPYAIAKFEKSAKRSAVDIATTSSMLNLQLEETTVTKCRIAFGGVAEYPKLAEKCMDFLIGKELTMEVVQEAATIAAAEFTPITDIRGSAEYRRLLIKNHIIKQLEDLL